MATDEAPFTGDVTWPVAVSFAWTTAFFFGVPAALEDRSAGPQKKGRYASVEEPRESFQRTYQRLLRPCLVTLVSYPKAGCCLGGGTGSYGIGKGCSGDKDPVTLYNNLHFHQHSLPLIPHIIITSRLFGGNQKLYLNR